MFLVLQAPGNTLSRKVTNSELGKRRYSPDDEVTARIVDCKL